MHPFATFVGLLACITCHVSAQTTTSAPPTSSADPWYTPPNNISKYALGGFVKARNVTSSINGLQQGFVTVSVKSAYEIMYRSNDSLANAVADVMTFLTPNNGNSSRLLSFSFAYDTTTNECSPSYSLTQGAKYTNGGELVQLVAALNNGWYVTTSDYEGLNAQFTAGIQSGHAVLDSIKASLTPEARALTGLSAGAAYAMFGYSGAGLAAEWAAEMASTYAPQLTNFVGAAVGGLTPNVTNVLLTVNKGPASGLSFKGIYGQTLAYSNLSDYLSAQLVKAKSADYYSYATACDGAGGSFKDFFSYFTPGKQILYAKVFQTVLSGSGQMGVHGVPRMPLYVYKGQLDEVSPVDDTSKLVRKYCDAGARVTYLINPIAAHISEDLIGTPAAFQYIADRFDGVAVPSSCVYQNVSLSKAVSVGYAVSSSIIDAMNQILPQQPMRDAPYDSTSSATPTPTAS